MVGLADVEPACRRARDVDARVRGGCGRGLGLAVDEDEALVRRELQVSRHALHRHDRRLHALPRVLWDPPPPRRSRRLLLLLCTLLVLVLVLVLFPRHLLARLRCILGALFLVERAGGRRRFRLRAEDHQLAQASAFAELGQPPRALHNVERQPILFCSVHCQAVHAPPFHHSPGRRPGLVRPHGNLHPEVAHAGQIEWKFEDLVQVGCEHAPAAELVELLENSASDSRPRARLRALPQLVDQHHRVPRRIAQDGRRVQNLHRKRRQPFRRRVIRGCSEIVAVLIRHYSSLCRDHQPTVAEERDGAERPHDRRLPSGVGPGQNNHAAYVDRVGHHARSVDGGIHPVRDHVGDRELRAVCAWSGQRGNGPPLA
mmetsp:Transcript_34434/g.81176  ORF Transcript_34434/g.81176 Transcript_34434/m.81176 type:complete len:372 (+) Transcript_34434:483-1598(+)